MIFVLEVSNSDEREFHYVFLNRAAMKFTGWDQDIIGRPIQDIHPLEEMAFCYKQVLVEQTSITFNSPFITKHGEVYDCEVQMTPLFNNNHDCTHVIMVTKVIEKNNSIIKKPVPVELNKLQEEYNLILNHSSNAIISFDLDGNIIYGNRAACRLTEFNSEDLVGKAISHLVVSEYKEQACDMFHQTELIK